MVLYLKWLLVSRCSNRVSSIRYHYQHANAKLYSPFGMVKSYKSNKTEILGALRPLNKNIGDELDTITQQKFLQPVLNGTEYTITLKNGQAVKLGPNSNYSGMTFVNCDLSALSLTACDFSGCKFYNCRIEKSEFSYSSFQDAIFRHCVLNESVFLFATLNSTILSHCDLTATRYSYAKISGAIFNENNMDQSLFLETQILNSKFLNCKFDECNMHKAKIDKTMFRNILSTELSWSLKGSFIQKVQFVNCKTVSTVAVGAVFAECLFDRSNFWKSVFVGCSFYDSKFLHTGFNESELKQNKFVNSTMSACRFRVCVFSNSTFKKCLISDCTLECADFRNVEFTDTPIENNYISNEHYFKTVFPTENQ